MTDLEQAGIEWEEPKEVWQFNKWVIDEPIEGPYIIIGDKGTRWTTTRYGNTLHLLKNGVYPTKRAAVISRHKHFEKILKQEQKDLDEKKQLLKKSYSEEYYE